jgi:dTDP-4-dehydrorhamnose reductase
MRWLVTGAHGQLGTHLVDQLAAANAGDEVIALGRADLDVTDSAAVHAAVRAGSPDVVVNAAAYTAVDAAETDEELAFQVNATAVEYLGQAVESVGARLIQVSTDYVFSGLAERP